MLSPPPPSTFPPVSSDHKNIVDQKDHIINFVHCQYVLIVALFKLEVEALANVESL